MENAPLPEVVARRPKSLRVETADSSVILRNPTLRSDTLSGLVGPQQALFRFDTRDIRSVSTPHANGAATAVGSVALVAGLLAVIYVIACDNPTCE